MALPLITHSPALPGRVSNPFPRVIETFRAQLPPDRLWTADDYVEAVRQAGIPFVAEAIEPTAGVTGALFWTDGVYVAFYTEARSLLVQIGHLLLQHIPLAALASRGIQDYSAAEREEAIQFAEAVQAFAPAAPIN